MKNKFSIALSLAVVLAMLITSLALADNLVTDGDGLVPVNDITSLNLGNVCKAGSASSSVYLLIKHVGQGQVYDNSATVSLSAVTTTSVSNSFSDGSIVLPADWTDLGNNVFSTDTARSTITVSAAAAEATGAKSGTVEYSATGGEDGSTGTLTRKATINLSWNVVNCAPVDNTAPSISYTLNPASPDGNNGWYKSNVTLTWTVSDPESAVTKIGCIDQNITVDQDATTYSCSATSAGGSATQVDVTIKRDATAPTISGSATPGANGAGWNKTDVNVSFSCNDNLSGIASCGPNSTLASDGAGQSAAGTAVDNAGNSTSTTVGPISIDKTTPTISGSATPASNGAGWNNSDVTVSFTCGDALSGVASCSGPSTLGEGANQSVTGTAIDVADNSASATVSGINVDKTAPTIAFVSPSTSSWYNADVTANWSCSDALSGEVSASVSATTSGEGPAQAATGTCADIADNTASDTQSFMVDKTAPVVTVTGVVNGATYTLGSVPAAGCSTTDALSGVATSASLSSSGGPVGSVTATCSGAMDVAGNPGSASATYSVIYNWTGFFQPIDNLPVLNRVKAGSAIPVKFSLGGNQGLSIFAAGYPVSTVTACGATATDDVETTVTAGGSSLSYDALANQYIYVWKTDKAWAGSCRTLTVKLTDGTIHQANFSFTK